MTDSQSTYHSPFAKKNRLFRNYYRIIYVSFAVILLITLLLTFFQYQAYKNHEQQQINHYLEQSQSRFNIFIERAAGYLDQMRGFAEGYLQRPALAYRHPLFTALQYQPKKDFFHLDSLPADFPKAENSNLTGLGNPQQYTAKAQENLHMSLHLTPMLRKIIQKIPNSRLAYYFGNKEALFVNIFPHTPSAVYRVQPHYWQLHYDIYYTVFPKYNPQRGPTWTKVYVDEAGNGLMVSVMLPVYKKDEFFGFFGVDLTLDSLNKITRSVQRNKGELFIINSRQQVLAHPTRVSSKDTIIKSLTQILPISLKDKAKTHFSERHKLQETTDYYIYRQAIPQTDWQLVYLLKKSDLQQELFMQLGLWLLFMVLLVLLILLITALFTQRYFIRPAEQLIKHIQQEQDNEREAYKGYIPSVWRKWFELVSHTFAQNRLALQMQQELNVNLENLVLERTTEIQAKNEEITAGNEELMQQFEELEQSREELSLKNNIIEEQNHALQKAKLELEKRVEERTLQLTEINQSLIDQNNQLEQYAFITAHNLRAPVARIIGLMNIIDKENLHTPENLLYMDKLAISAEELDMIIKDLNVVVDVKKHTQEKIETIELQPILAEVLQNLEKEIDTNQAIIKSSWQVATVPFVRPYLRSIFYNLISNAIKYRTLEHIPEIEISTETVGDFTLLQFKDNGLGFDLGNYQNKVFQIYQRFHSHVAGKGMGLYPVKIQVESIGGRIELESTLNEGSTFKIYIPMSKVLIG
jgi:signal transduction histidine kinase